VNFDDPVRDRFDWDEVDEENPWRKEGAESDEAAEENPQEYEEEEKILNDNIRAQVEDTEQAKNCTIFCT